MILRILSLLSLIAISTSTLFARSTEDFPPDESVVYKTIGEVQLQMHFFYPDDHEVGDSRPAIVFFHGGGWKGGDPNSFYPHCRYLASRGMVAATAQYRLSNVHGTTPKECVMDAKSAIRWMRSNAGQYGVDPDKIIAGGGSAGGHMAAATAFVEGFDEAGEDTSINCRPSALVLINPVFDNSPNGYGYERVKDYWEAFSPLHNIREAAPPSIVFLGTEDKLIPVSTAQDFKRRIEAAGSVCELQLYEGAGHGFYHYHLGHYYEKTVAAMDHFLVDQGYLPKQPNILFVFADDWGCYSESYAKIEETTPWNAYAPTPHFDRIAQEGVLFRNAFVGAPQCTPCRSSLLSGQYFYRTGLAAVQDGIWDFTNPSFPMLLREAGYHAGYTSKVWSPGTPRDAPYGGVDFQYGTRKAEFNEFSQTVYKLMDEGVAMETAKQRLFDQVRNYFRLFLADRKPGQPFCYWFGSTNPHREWIKGSGKKLWGIDPDDLAGNMPPFLPDVHEVREDLADYFGENLAFDLMLGVLLEELEAIDELDNTMIVVSGDHGAPGFTNGKCNQYDFGTRVALAVRWGKNPRPGRVVDDFVNLMDLAPTLLEIGNVDVPEVMDGNSILPLLLSEKEGQIDDARDYVVTGRERHVSTAREGRMPYPQRALRTREWLYIINFKPDRWPGGSPWNITADSAPTQFELEYDTFITHPDMDGGPTKAFLVSNRSNPDYAEYYDVAFAKRPRVELYDLKKDPQQVNNVAGQSEYKEQQARLDKRLMEVLRSTGDPRVMGDGSRFDKMPYTFEKWVWK